MRAGWGVRTVAVAVGVLVTPLSALGFSVDNHEKITAEAVGVIRWCAERDPANWGSLDKIDAQADTLRACNALQDVPQRKLILWHFQGEGKGLQGSFWKGSWLNLETSFNGYYQGLIAGLKGARPPGETAASDVGALLHFIQDMSVPAHVVPVFHPSPLWRPDGFDGFDYQKPLPETDEAKLERCNTLRRSSEGQSFETLLSHAIARTLSELDRPIPEAGKPWRTFWESKPQGFGRYGCGGDKFSKIHFSCEGEQISIPRARYETFARVLQRAAVDDSVRAILIADGGKLLAAQPGPFNCPVAAVGPGRTLQICRERSMDSRGRTCTMLPVSVLWKTLLGPVHFIVLSAGLLVVLGLVVVLVYGLAASVWRALAGRRER